MKFENARNPNIHNYFKVIVNQELSKINQQLDNLKIIHCNNQSVNSPRY